MDTLNSILLAFLVTSLIAIGVVAYGVHRYRLRLEKSYAPFGILRAAIAREQDRGREIQSANIELERQFRLRQAEYQTRLESLHSEALEAQDRRDLLDAAFYATDFRFDDTGKYRAAIESVRDRQRRLVLAGDAIHARGRVKVGNSEAKGQALAKNIGKLMLRAFNGECDAALATLTWKNYRRMEDRIKRSKLVLDRLGKRLSLEVSPAYEGLKLEELRLSVEQLEVKERQREAERRARAEAREEAKYQRELERKKCEVAEELRAAEAERARVEQEVSQATGPYLLELEAMRARNAELVAQLEERSRALSNAERTRKGHVYIISNVGSLGPDIVKIGMTRRDDPEDRIWELGDASVPFPFDRHLVLFHDDAPALESELHNAFWNRRVNHANDRKEFFRVRVEEVVAYLESRGFRDLPVQLSPEAKEFQQTKLLLSSPSESARDVESP